MWYWTIYGEKNWGHKNFSAIRAFTQLELMRAEELIEKWSAEICPPGSTWLHTGTPKIEGKTRCNIIQLMSMQVLVSPSYCLVVPLDGLGSTTTVPLCPVVIAVKTRLYPFDLSTVGCSVALVTWSLCPSLVSTCILSLTPLPMFGKGFINQL